MASIQKVTLGTGDVLVVKCQGAITEVIEDRIRERVKSQFGDVPLLILGDAIDLFVFHNAASKNPSPERIINLSD